MNDFEKQQIENIRKMSDEDLLDIFWKCVSIKYNAGMELYYGRDVEKAFPKDKYKIYFFSEFKEDDLYYIANFNYQTNTIELNKIKIWGESYDK